MGAQHTSSHIWGISASIAAPQIKCRCSSFSGYSTRAEGSVAATEGDSCAGYKCQAARLDKARAVVLPLYRRMVRAVLEVLRETGGQSDKVALEFQSRGSHEGGIRGEMYRLEPHDHGEPVSRNLSADGKELSRPVLVGALPNLEEGV